MKVVVTGGGAIGRHLAADLVARGHEVTLIEQDRATVEDLRQEIPEVTRDARRRLRALGARGRRAARTPTSSSPRPATTRTTS